MPQPRSTSSRSSGGSARTSRAKSGTGSTAKRATASSSSASKRSASGSSASKRGATSARASASTGKRATSSAGKRATSSGGARTRAASAAGGVEAQFEVVAQRIRKLNERIIEASREAGQGSLNAYEKALKSIATGLDRGAGRSDVEWVSHMLSTQAKFIRDVTDSLTSAARSAMK